MRFFLLLLTATTTFAHPKDEQLLISCWEQLSPWVTEDPFKNWGSVNDLNPIRKIQIDGKDTYFWFDFGKSKIYAFNDDGHGDMEYMKNKKHIKQEPPEIQDLADGVKKPTDAIKADYEKLRSTFKTDVLSFCFGKEVAYVAGIPIYLAATKTLKIDYRLWKIRGPLNGECILPESKTLVAKPSTPDDFSEVLFTHIGALILEKANRVSQAGLNGSPDPENYLGRELQKNEVLQPTLFSKSEKVLAACQPVMDFALEKKWIKKSDADEARAGLEFTIRGWRPKVVEKAEKP